MFVCCCCLKLYSVHACELRLSCLILKYKRFWLAFMCSSILYLCTYKNKNAYSTTWPWWYLNFRDRVLFVTISSKEVFKFCHHFHSEVLQRIIVVPRVTVRGCFTRFIFLKVCRIKSLLSIYFSMFFVPFLWWKIKFKFSVCNYENNCCPFRSLAFRTIRGSKKSWPPQKNPRNRRLCVLRCINSYCTQLKLLKSDLPPFSFHCVGGFWGRLNSGLFQNLH